MLYEDIFRSLPDRWSPMPVDQTYCMIEIPKSSSEYSNITSEFQAECGIGPLYRIQNPVLYAKYCLKKSEYARRGYYSIVPLFHDTVQSNVDSISTYNIDWRFGER